jgi:hypothetical protein
MAPTPLVSVIIPAYNAARWLPESVASCREGGLHRLEIIVVDDGSTDDTPAVVRRLAGPDLVYHQQENRGLSGARNAGIDIARGAYIKFLDADDFLLPGSLRAQAAFLARTPGISVVTGNSYRCDGDGNLYRRMTLPAGPVSARGLVVCNLFPIHAPLFRREPMDAGFRFETALSGAADWDFLTRLVLSGASFHHLSHFVCAYRTFAGSMSSDPDRQTLDAMQVIDRIYTRTDLPAELRPLEAQARADACSHGVARACSVANEASASRWLAGFLDHFSGTREDAAEYLLPRLAAAARNPLNTTRRQFLQTFRRAARPLLPGLAAHPARLEAALLRDDFARARDFGTSMDSVLAFLKLYSHHPFEATRQYAREIGRRFR